MSFVKLASKLPSRESCNGLDHLAEKLVAEPRQPVYALVRLGVDKVTLDVETGARVPTVKVERIEPFDGLPEPVGDLAFRAAERRLGKVPLPFDEAEAGGVEAQDGPAPLIDDDIPSDDDDWDDQDDDEEDGL
jgi:hypothetical protein